MRQKERQRKRKREQRKTEQKKTERKRERERGKESEREAGRGGSLIALLKWNLLIKDTYWDSYFIYCREVVPLLEDKMY